MTFYKDKRVLVAGGTGTIGIPTVRLLVEAGATVTVVSMDSSDYAALVLPHGVKYVRADLTLLENALAATADQDFVFNLVGIKGSVGLGQSKVASYLVPMLWFQTNLMEAAFRNRVARFLFVGSICSYPCAAEPKREESLWDGQPLQNDRIPGLAKRIGEIQGEAYQLEHGWDAVRVVRPSNVYGPFDDFNPASAQVIPSLIRRIADGENPLKIWGDGSAVRDFIFSEDLAYWLLVTLAEAPASEPLNLGAGRGTTIRELAETLAGLAPNPPAIEWQPDKPAGDPIRILSTEKAARLIGFGPRRTLREGLGITFDWFRRNRDLALRRSAAQISKPLPPT